MDKDGLFWIGTENGGVSVFNPQTKNFEFHLKEHPDGKGSFTVNTFFQDEASNFWIGTWDRGLLKYNPTTQELVAFYTDKKNLVSISGNNIKKIVQKENPLVKFG